MYRGCTGVYKYDLRFTEIMIYIFHTACIVGRHNSTCDNVYIGMYVNWHVLAARVVILSYNDILKLKSQCHMFHMAHLFSCRCFFLRSS